VAHVQVQGASAPDQIIRALNYFNGRDELPEVIVLIRGGGSADDLSAFNDEQLVRAIAASRVPTLVGVGHEVDESLADLAADVRAATPSNAAQILVPDKQEIIRASRYQVQSLLPRLTSAIDQQSNLLHLTLGDSLDRIQARLDQSTDQLALVRRVLSQLNPATVLARGYALIRGNPSVGAVIELETDKHIIKAEVKHVQAK
jgi:exodeoxyribonuclease VII large subunit